MKKSKNSIRVVGAREHNLKNISVEIPKNTLTVITGPSGSGKSSLAMDVVHAEGQRRYLESLSSYARQFLGMPKKPDVDSIEGLCPAIAIDQKTVGKNPRSTVGTITELYDYLRVLFARIGEVFCPTCHKAIQAASPEVVGSIVFERYQGSFIMIGALIAQEKKGEFAQELKQLIEKGFTRFIIDGQRKMLRSVDDIASLGLKKTYKHTIMVLIDACDVSKEESARIHEAVEKAFALSGTCTVHIGDNYDVYSAQRMCTTCGWSAPELEPRLFSFNSPLGACKSCHGLGTTVEYAYKAQEDETDFKEVACATCAGKRLNQQALAVKIKDKSIYDLSELSLKQAQQFFASLQLPQYQMTVAEKLLREINNRINFLCDVGLNYLSMNRTARTLSGGEGQRIRIATQLGSQLSGIVYILDEPSIGLHQRDNDRLIGTLLRLRDQDNTVLVVEHDHDTMLASDYIIDMGPAAGVLGGSVIASGTPQEIQKNKASLTGAYLAGRRAITTPSKRRQPKGFITVHDVQANNLKKFDAKFPLGVLCGISGVSGSGKSSLIMEELVPAIKGAFTTGRAVEVSKITGIETLESMVVIDQSPIGRTPRSNPATYLGIFDEIRKLFASLPESNVRGYNAGRFSFNVGEGRCATCSGDGVLTISMHFLPDVVMTCHRCKGLRYNPQTLEIMYKGKNIAEVLAMTAREAHEFFAHHTPLAKRLALMCEVGLDYVALGQSSTTLSGGEAQRIKLVDELAKRGSNTLYILDEPTTGLHTSDIEKLLHVFNRLVEKGNTLVIIEHNVDVLKTMDYLIDLGPEAGDEGGQIVAQGTPEVVAQSTKSYTARYIKPLLNKVL